MKRIIGITGGIASGKSNVCSILKDEGYEVIDSDEIAKELSRKPNACYEAILKAFGPEFLDKQGEINRSKLSRLVFSNSAARAVLDKVTHPQIITEVKRQLSLLPNGLIFVDIPLLYEGKFEYLCDKIICVYLPKKLQVERLMKRDGIDEDLALAKIHSQMDLYLKKTYADFVIDSSGSFSETKEKTLQIIQQLKGEE